MKIQLAMQIGDARSALGWNFVKRLERLVNELNRQPGCPEIYWVIFFVKWDQVERKIKEFWGVDSKKPKIKLGEIIYEVDRIRGKADFWALPLDIPVPETVLSDEIVHQNADFVQNIPLNDHDFVKI